MVILLDYYFLVCVIDFGIIFFGIVYLLKCEYWDDLMRIIVLDWNVLLFVQIFYKILIIILLDNKRKFVVFGYEVEFKYVEFVEDEEYDEYFYC